MARTHRTAVVPAHKEHCFTHVSPGSFTVAASVQADKRPRIAPSCADVGRTTRCPVDLSAGGPWTSFNSPSRRDLDRYHHRHLGLLDLETRQHFLRGSIYARHGSFRTTPGPLSWGSPWTQCSLPGLWQAGTHESLDWWTPVVDNYFQRSRALGTIPLLRRLSIPYRILFVMEARRMLCIRIAPPKGWAIEKLPSWSS